MKRDLLLVSNTKTAGKGRFAHAREQITELLGDRRTVTFIPYANPSGVGYERYLEVLEPTFQEMGYALRMVDENPVTCINNAQAIFIGGGNTWELLRSLKDKGLFYPIREAVSNGIPYLGSSAGSNVAGLTIGQHQ